MSCSASTAHFLPPIRPARAKTVFGKIVGGVTTPARGVALLMLTTLLARLAFAGALGLGIDESYMVASGRTLQLGYFDHPPLAWWMAWAASHIAGSDSAFFVRLPFVLLFALTTWLMFRLTTRLFSACAGLWAAALLNAAPVLGITDGGWVLPDGPLSHLDQPQWILNDVAGRRITVRPRDTRSALGGCPDAGRPISPSGTKHLGRWVALSETAATLPMKLGADLL